MNTWKVQNPNRLLTEIKNKLSGPYSVGDIKWSIEHNRCFVNQSIERFASASVQKGDCIFIAIEKRPAFQIESDRILYEDAWLLVYNKPPFLTSENLAQMTQCTLVHRLDRDTSGAILLAKEEFAKRNLEEQFRSRVIYKEYYALVEGIMEKKGTISGNMAPLQRREGAVLWAMAKEGLWSQTHWRLIGIKKNTSLIQCVPVTGRTHQIRVHLKHIGHPLVGDFTYGSPKYIKNIFRPMLHARRIKFAHPQTEKSLLISAPLPSDFSACRDCSPTKSFAL